jgi:predicted  nucleic acid-binding Zn-ribbon protein
VARADQAVVAAVATRDKVTGETRANDRELAGYVEKRDRTRKMIETGSAPDYAAAEKQLAGCSAVIDELETKALELMEAADAARAALAAAEKAKIDASNALAEARKALAARDAPIRAELLVQIEKQKVAAVELPADHRVPYSELRRKKRPALVNIDDAGNCSHCSTKIPLQTVAEARSGKALVTCRGCSGWILP